jgi:hypothetical protein
MKIGQMAFVQGLYDKTFLDYDYFSSLKKTGELVQVS